MKKLLLITTLALALSACQQSSDTASKAPTQGEIDMAEMMGITVEELRNQTPEEHMRMMQDMMQGNAPSSANNQPGDVSLLPEAAMPQIIEVSDGDTVELEATLVKQTVDGVARPMYAYNGQIPGPIFKADQTAEFTVVATNNIDMDTTVHWHGLRIDNASDGVPDLTQPPIAPGESYTYTVTVPDEGVYWYHPHVREDKQQDMGLYGNLLVRPESDTAYPPANQEEILVLDDLLISDDALNYGEETAVYPLMGRYGNRMVVNGQVADSGQPALQLSVPQQSVVRYYITNVANTRTFRLNFGVPMKVMAGDVGRFESAFFADTLTIAPAERYIVDVFYDEAGPMPLLHQPPIGISTPLVGVSVTGEAASPVLTDSFEELQENTDVQADIARYSDQFDRPVDKTLRLSIETPMNHSMMMHHDDGGIEWEDTMPMMNRMMTGKQLKWKLIDDETKLENMNIKWQFTQGDLIKIRIINDKESAHPMQHPVHFHGQRFLVLSQDGEPVDNKVWKDTVLVPTGSSVDILMEMSNPGKWMFHCHIAEHLTNGMMGMFTVNPA